MKAEGVPTEDPGCGGKAAVVLGLIVVGLFVTFLAAVPVFAPAPAGPWPDPTLSPPAVGASR